MIWDYDLSVTYDPASSRSSLHLKISNHNDLLGCHSVAYLSCTVTSFASVSFSGNYFYVLSLNILIYSGCNFKLGPTVI